MTIKKLDSNNRLDPVLHRTDDIKEDKLKRVVDVALPFLVLYKPTMLLSSAGMGAVQSFTILSGIKDSYNKNELKVLFKQSCRLVYVISSVCISIFFPIGYIFLASLHWIQHTLYVYYNWLTVGTQLSNTG